VHFVQHHHRRGIRGRQTEPDIWGADRFVASGVAPRNFWLWRDTSDAERIASHAQSTFWYVLPSLPMFLLLPAMLRAGVGFWPSIGASCALTIVLYFITAWSLAKFGIIL
jgi:hypothetical protein